MKKISFILFLIKANFAFTQTLENPLYNPRAETNFNENLSVNDLAIAVDNSLSLQTVKIFQKKDGLYQVGSKDITEWEIKNKPNSLKWYKSNSVYKYYDVYMFNNRLNKYKTTLESFFLCFCEKYKIKLEIVSGKKDNPIYYIKDKLEYNKLKTELNELFDILQKEFPVTPNTYLPYDKNPLIWWNIAKEKSEHLECLSKVENPNITKVIDFYLKEIASAKKSAETFNGGNSDLYNNSSYDWMYRAVSKKARTEYIETQKGWNNSAESVIKINKALDDLSLICKDKIYKLKVADELFQYHDMAIEQLMKSYLKNPSTLKIYKQGLSDSDWIIIKNELGIPLNRYKRGTMWALNTADDHGLCKALFFVIKQNYSGGGSYGKSFISQYNEELRGCP